MKIAPLIGTAVFVWVALPVLAPNTFWTYIAPRFLYVNDGGVVDLKPRAAKVLRVAFLAFAIAALTSILTGCGGGWQEQDTQALTVAIHAQQALVRSCAGADAGCPGDRVEAVDRAVECNLGSILVRHDQDPAGVDEKACRP